MQFEFEIEEIQHKIDELTRFSEEKEIDLSDEINKLKDKRDIALKVLYDDLSDWQRVAVSRHPARPYTLDYIEMITEDFVELHGDRLFKDDPAIVGGLCKIDGKKFMVIGHQKGRTMKEKVFRNFGMANPEGYRKALRLFEIAERFKIPVLTFIDTPGAYPGLEAEKHGQGEAIARNLMEMSGLRTPIISVVIGEGGSGGALGLGVADKVFMLENSTYSVISPEGCAA
ncbi:acetyl-CoA carboxylase carboxyltransferase subunit alpha, partial [Fusobacterium sp.]